MLIEKCPPSASSGPLQAIEFIRLGLGDPTPIMVGTPRRNTRVGWKSLLAFDSPLPIGIGLDQAGVDCESFTTDQPLLDAAAQDALEHATEEIALPEEAMPVLGNVE
jgi:hypothetical protein